MCGTYILSVQLCIRTVRTRLCACGACLLVNMVFIGKQRSPLCPSVLAVLYVCGPPEVE